MLPNNLPATAKAVFGYFCKALIILVVLVASIWIWQCAPDWLKSGDEIHQKMRALHDKVASLEKKIAEMKVVQEPAWWEFWNLPAYWTQQKIKNEISEAKKELVLVGKDWRAQLWLILHTHYFTFAWVLFTVLFLPFLWRTTAYWLLMPLLGRALPASTLLESKSAGNVKLASSGKPLQVTLTHGEKLYVQQGQITHRNGVINGDRVCWNMAAPLISSAAHLWWIIVLSKEPDAPSGSVTLSTGDPDCYIAELELKEHPGLVIRPSRIVAVSDGVGIQTQWRWGLHHWLNGQLRYVLFSGTGRVWVKAQGGVAKGGDTGGDTQRPSRLEHPLVIAYDGRAKVAATRTQSFFAYVFGSSELCDLEIAHGYLHLHQQTVPNNFSHALQNSFTFVLQSIGKLAGL